MSNSTQCIIKIDTNRTSQRDHAEKFDDSVTKDNKE